MKLLINGLIKFVCGLFIVALLVFLPAGTIEYFGGLLFVGVLFVPILILGAVLYLKAPDLLAKRLDSKEKQGAQKAVVALSALGFIAGFVVAGLDFRFGWSRLPVWVSAVASALFLISYGLYAEVMRETAYISRTVKVEEGQQVVSTGLYGIVRHPMYAATVLMFMMIPLILGSLPSFVIFLHYPVLIAVRIKNEEKLLVRELAGYEEYRNKVKYRLIPFVW